MSEKVASALSFAFEEAGRLADLLDAIAQEPVQLLSRLGVDNSEVEPAAFTSYVTNRAQNAARLAGEVRASTLLRMPGKIHLEFSALYPLLRAVLEDCACLIWLLSPDDRRLRLTRFLRLLGDDQKFFIENHRLLGVVASDDPEVVAGSLPLDLVKHMESERLEAAKFLEGIASKSGIAVQELTPVTIKALFIETYGEADVVYPIWKMLSDLSHFSYLMTKHLSTTEFEGEPVSYQFLLAATHRANRSMERVMQALAVAVTG